MKKVIVITIIALLIGSSVHSQDINNYLIIEDVGNYKKITKGGPAGNILAAAGHFGLDHKDKSYGIAYVNDETQIWVNVRVTQHAGSDSDKWLLHELDMDFRNYYGLPGRSYGPRQIESQTILEDAAGGRNYRWISGNKVIVIEYHDSQMTKPEPIEVVKAYLAKHLSTLTAMKLAELRSPEMKTTWIKDEMDRRLWLCDKWFLYVQMGKAELSDILRTVVKYLTVFLDYRERYYGITSRDEKIKLMGYLDVKDGTAIKNKLTEYKTWWSVNKTKSISLP